MSVVTYAQVQDTIARHWGFTALRPMQQEAIQANLKGSNLLLVLPTGGGKSLCYQAPAACRSDQLTLVVSPLIALMKDQVDSLNANGVPAVYINSSLSMEEREENLFAMKQGRVRLAYVAPERLVMEEFISFLQTLPLASIAIDEAHCISHWGHDFRPEYRQLSFLAERFPQVPVHAFTATATEKVRADIVAQLKLADPCVMVGDFHRANLHYRVVPRESEWSQAKQFLEDHRGQAGIIYCMRRRDVDDLVSLINSWGFSARGYHAGMDQSLRKKAQDAFRQEECNLIVATVAFGMGIDRPDVRFVLHMAMPKSLEHYQQESGRAGRDGLEAECVLLHHRQDVVDWSKLMQKSAEESEGDSSWLPVALSHLNEMDRYCKVTICRHRQLVNHFGQQFSKTNCSACDVCLGDADPVTDSLLTAQKLLSAIARCEERFGATHLISVLRGERTENVIKHGHDQLSVFGLMADNTKDQLRDWYDQLASQGLLEKEEFTGAKGVGFILKLNAESWKVFRKERTAVQLWKQKRVEKLRKARTRNKLPALPVEEGLFTELQSLRRKLAGQNGVAPYVICHDATLNALASHRPSTREGLFLIPGLGQAKINKFGNNMLRIIKQYSHIRGLSMDVGLIENAPTKVVSQSSRPTTHHESWKMFEQGHSVDLTASLLKRAPSTVRKYLEEYLLANPRPSPEPWMNQKDAHRIKEFAATLSDGRLKPIHEHFAGEFTFDQIRIALSWIPV